MAISIFSLLRTLSAWRKGNFQISTHNLSFLKDWVLSQGVFSQSHTSTAGNIWVWPPSPSQAAFPQPQPFHSRIHQQDPRSCFVIYNVQEIDFPPQLPTFIIKVLWCRVHLQPFLHFFRINMMWINCFSASQLHIFIRLERTLPWRSAQAGGQHPPETHRDASMNRNRFQVCSP